MAIAIVVNACMKGYKVRFYTVTELVLKLAEARKNGTLERLRNDLNGLDLLMTNGDMFLLIVTVLSSCFG